MGRGHDSTDFGELSRVELAEVRPRLQFSRANARIRWRTRHAARTGRDGVVDESPDGTPRTTSLVPGGPGPFRACPDQRRTGRRQGVRKGRTRRRVAIGRDRLLWYATCFTVIGVYTDDTCSAPLAKYSDFRRAVDAANLVNRIARVRGPVESN